MIIHTLSKQKNRNIFVFNSTLSAKIATLAHLNHEYYLIVISSTICQRPERWHAIRFIYDADDGRLSDSY
jgi:hypothetical protein